MQSVVVLTCKYRSAQKAGTCRRVQTSRRPRNSTVVYVLDSVHMHVVRIIQGIPKCRSAALSHLPFSTCYLRCPSLLYYHFPARQMKVPYRPCDSLCCHLHPDEAFKQEEGEVLSVLAAASHCPGELQLSHWWIRFHGIQQFIQIASECRRTIHPPLPSRLHAANQLSKFMCHPARQRPRHAMQVVVYF